MLIHVSRDAHLGTYLNDHLAGATAGVELIRRLTVAERATDYGPELRRLAAEIAEDRRSLLDLVERLDLPRARHKALLAWAGEKVTRLKLNGRLLFRSPLSRVVELETMRLGVEGKAACWRTLRQRAVGDSRLDVLELDRLLERAEEQSGTLERLRARAITEAFG
ncbi:hypothetical protein [Amycolatopsis albispora]|uniref:Uncharacterized protein n=1 Tax=Amycolatopsis albispora TaxID=1804986 RepID=A0A344LJ88_9PSEU|nr:hypothetical protein [Amycolatopsis albispora]AXB48112.1 hypothetical protein A4R43_41440 [Amycolatopsis albispora]